MGSKNQEKNAVDDQVGLVPAIYEQILDPGIDTIQGIIDDASPEILEHIPIIKYFRAITKIGMGIKERIFVRKLAYLILGVSGLSLKDKADWAEKLEEKKKKKEFGEKLIMTLDMLDDYIKATWLGNALKQHIVGDIDTVFFNSLSRSIQLLNPDHVVCLCEFYKQNKTINDILIHSIAVSGFVSVQYVGFSAGTVSGVLEDYQHVSIHAACVKNELGSYFCNHIVC